MLIKKNIYPAVMNAANEIAVELFLNGKIKFIDIEKIIYDEVNDQYYEQFLNSELTLEKIIFIDQTAKTRISKKYLN